MANVVELQDLVKAFTGLYPVWLVELLAEVPLCGLRLGWTKRPPRDPGDISWAVWSGPREAQVESLRTDWPGRFVLPLGYINVAGDGSYCGNPYFVLADGNPDPALYQIYHDGGQTGEGLVATRRFVAPSLSAFFRTALVRVPPELAWDDEDAEPDSASDRLDM
ncbi:hypothetical protein [Fimbriiglobus ruber]|uniref:hypothetical protein n=1 Tax=Fimbriiglobus ruber TaxID=1908690 RepID=UPI000B4B29B4|nr:hypothetical protein [Fimbriiglobus ruber]